MPSRRSFQRFSPETAPERTRNAFVADVASRLRNRVQSSTDGLRRYITAVGDAFGADHVDHAQIVKSYETG
jgi:hypothetical protein